jgi:hypothetical protein
LFKKNIRGAIPDTPHQFLVSHKISNSTDRRNMKVAFPPVMLLAEGASQLAGVGMKSDKLKKSIC